MCCLGHHVRFNISSNFLSNVLSKLLDFLFSREIVRQGSTLTGFHNSVFFVLKMAMTDVVGEVSIIVYPVANVSHRLFRSRLSVCLSVGLVLLPVFYQLKGCHFDNWDRKDEGTNKNLDTE